VLAVAAVGQALIFALSGSVALLADLIHNFGDALTAIPVEGCVLPALHAGPDVAGATRWRCPFCAGRMRSRQIPASMRRSRSTPLVDPPAGAACCNGIVTASAEELPHHQQLFPRTTAWRISYNRRQVV